ncbi:hypothetical protein [Rheinheimera sp. WS51]|uniref:hypothetical protein n=1 Tax=Rheinheimera sp. WS51 TaxID=3425886 RepID=UPI003D92BDB6
MAVKHLLLPPPEGQIEPMMICEFSAATAQPPSSTTVRFNLGEEGLRQAAEKMAKSLAKNRKD